MGENKSTTELVETPFPWEMTAEIQEVIPREHLGI
jgi:hypothetical protein